jgi:peptidyl-prolyl cis-trans isomerase C
MHWVLLYVVGVGAFYTRKSWLPGLYTRTPAFLVGKKVAAKHILVPTRRAIATAQARVAAGEPFSAVARETSTCPSRMQGGDLGTFGPGETAPAFDKVCFDPSTVVGAVNGPIQTTFGFHLIVVTSRNF